MKPVNATSGWRIWQQNAAPMPLVHTLNAGMRELREYFGSALWTSVVVFEENQGKWLFRPKELMLLGQKMIDFLMCPPYRVAFLTGYENSKKALLDKTADIQFLTGLSALDNSDLVELFNEYCHLYYDWYKYGWFCEPIQFQSQEILQAYLEKEMQAKQPQLDMKKAVQALSAIDNESFSLCILRHLELCMRALGEALKDDKLRNDIESLKGASDFAARAADTILANMESAGTGKLAELLQLTGEHSKQFYWKRNNYFSSTFIDQRAVIEELLGADDFDISAPEASIKAEIVQAEENRKRLLTQKREVQELLPPYHKAVSVLAGLIGGALIDDRKQVIMMVNGAFDLILAEAGKRAQVDLADCRYLIPQEFEHFLMAPQEYHDRLQRRKECFVVFQGDHALLDELCNEVGTRSDTAQLSYNAFAMPDPFIAEGEQAEKLLNQLDGRLCLFENNPDLSVDRLHGVIAYHDESKSFIVGRVRVITDPKAEQLERGEILVAPSTTPDYMEAIRRCSAIVTDWGGQTSHAATVSRELHKPCIIGTNYASQVLRNGDQVRLDLNTGVIEII